MAVIGLYEKVDTARYAGEDLSGYWTNLALPEPPEPCLRYSDNNVLDLNYPNRTKFNSTNYDPAQTWLDKVYEYDGQSSWFGPIFNSSLGRWGLRGPYTADKRAMGYPYQPPLNLTSDGQTFPESAVLAPEAAPGYFQQLDPEYGKLVSMTDFSGYPAGTDGSAPSDFGPASGVSPLTPAWGRWHVVG